MTTTIKATLVNDANRLSFLPTYFGSSMFTAEQSIYNTLSSLCETYKGAYWDFYELDNGGFYLAPQLDEQLPICVISNGYEGILSADAAGIVSSLCVINHLCWKTSSEKMIDYYYWLRDFASEHVEASEIFAAID